MDCTEIMKLFS